jgi:serine/threonine protein kinase
MAQTPEDAKTVVGSLASPPSAPQEQSQNALPLGYRLGEFEVTGTVGVGGFGIVYLAHDHSLERRVALKEYMPSSLAERMGNTEVRVKAEPFAETFTIGKRSFVNEAKLLAQFDHPSLVKVYRFWESNGTAYMVMPYYEGITLRQRLREMPGSPDEQWLKQLLAPLMDALEVIHREQCYHRDIAPDNILLLKDGTPLLLDFGAARRVIGDATQALTVILKPGYAPIEQYAEVPGLKQGAYTDVYALAAVLHTAITGKPPPAAVGRMMNDTMEPLRKAAAGRYSDSFLHGIDRSLAVKPQERPQSIAEMRALLGLDTSARAEAPARVRETDASRPRPAPSDSRPDPAPRVGSKAVPAIAAGVVALAVAAGAWWMVSSREDAVLPAVPDQSRPGSATKAQFSAVGALDDIFEKRNREHTVAFALDQARVRINQDKLTFRLSSSRPGFLYVFMVGTDRQHFHLLFPNALDEDNRVEAGKELALPRTGWAMVAGGPPGTNHFVAVVSESARDFSASGLRKIEPFAEFPLADAAVRWNKHLGPWSPFLGAPSCPAGTGGCSPSYGAAFFTIEEVN